MKTGAGQQDFVDTMIEVIGRWHGSWQDPEIAESKALAYRVRRLELNGWVTRDLDPDDRRSVLVTLTPAGKKRALEVFSAKTDTWHALLSALSPADQRRLNDDLRTVLLALEGPAQPALQPLRIPARAGRRSTPACQVLKRYTPAH